MIPVHADSARETLQDSQATGNQPLTDMKMRSACARLILPTLPLLFCVAFNPAMAQDAGAVRRATDLRQQGATADLVVRDISTSFRLDPPGVAVVLRAANFDAADAGAGLATAMRVQPQAVLVALLDGGYDEASATRSGARLGLDAGGAASVFRARNTSGVRAVGAIADAYRLDVRAVAVHLRAVDYPPEEAALGLRTLTRNGAEAIESMKLADFHPEVLRDVTTRFFARTPEEYVSAMRAAGEPVEPVATTLRNVYGLTPLAGAILLYPLGPDPPYSAAEMIRALRVVWELDALAAYAVLQEHPITWPIPWMALEAGGYSAPTPEIYRYRIADYRPGQSGQRIENLGVVDGSRVSPGSPETWDGEVEVLVGLRDLDGLEATLGGRVGTLVGREPYDFVDNGTSFPGEWLRFRFTDFSSGNLILSRTGRTSAEFALALAYHVVDGDLFAGPIGALTVVIGSPQGSGQVMIPGGTYGGVPVAESLVELEVPTHRGTGIESNVVDLSSNEVSVTTRALGPGTIEMNVEVLFEESGAEVVGTFVEYVPCWSCGTFQVPQSVCAFGNWGCFLTVLGQTMTTLGSCANLDNWEESEMASGPAIPFEADLTAPKLALTVTVGAQAGEFLVYPVASQFTAGISLRAGPASVPLGPLLQGWILGQVNDQLRDSVAAADLPGLLSSSLGVLDATLNFGSLRGLYLTADGRWFIDSSY